MKKVKEQKEIEINKNQEKGITLIALIITIIVLLILASVSIVMLTGENGILLQAKNAKNRTEESGAIEKVKLAITSCINENGLNITNLEDELNKVQGMETNLTNLTRDSFPLEIIVDGKKINVFLNGEVELASDMTKPAYVIIYDKGTKTQDGLQNAYEMVFQRGNKVDESKKVIATYTDFENENIEGQDRLWKDLNKNIETIEFIDIIRPITMESWFAGMENCKEIKGLEKVDTRECKKMNGLFYGCKLLNVIETEYLNTKSCTDFSWMFQNCTLLENINISNWNVEKGENFNGMFIDCTSIKSLNLKDWNLKSATCYNMFGECTQLETLGDIGNWNTEDITDFSYMFYNCKSLKNVNVKNWNTAKVKTFANMFDGCTSIEELDITNWDTSSSSNISNIFNGMDGLNKITVGNKFNNLGNGTSWCSFPKGVWKNTLGVEYAENLIPNLKADTYIKVQ